MFSESYKEVEGLLQQVGFVTTGLVCYNRVGLLQQGWFVTAGLHFLVLYDYFTVPGSPVACRLFPMQLHNWIQQL